MNKKLKEELKKALLAYMAGKTIEAGDASYSHNGGAEFFKVGGIVYTNFSPPRAPENLDELKKRLIKIQEETEDYSQEFAFTIETWLAVLGQLVGM